MGPRYVKLALIPVPAVFVDRVHFAGAHLLFFDVVVAAKCVDGLSPDRHSWKEGDFARHRRFVLDVFVDVVEAVVAEAAEEEPRTHIFVLFLGQWLLALSATIQVYGREVAREFTLVLADKAPTRELC